MSKFRVAFDVDLTNIAPELSVGSEDVEATVSNMVSEMLLSQARAHAREELHKVRKDTSIDSDVKVLKMGEQLRKIMLTLMAEANLKIQPLPNDVVIHRELPFEREYSQACAA